MINLIIGISCVLVYVLGVAFVYDLFTLGDVISPECEPTRKIEKWGVSLMWPFWLCVWVLNITFLYIKIFFTRSLQ